MAVSKQSIKTPSLHLTPQPNSKTFKDVSFLALLLCCCFTFLCGGPTLIVIGLLLTLGNTGFGKPFGIPLMGLGLVVEVGVIAFLGVLWLVGALQQVEKIWDTNESSTEEKSKLAR